MSPEDLARELNISGLTLRNWLRQHYPRPDEMKYQRWDLDDHQVAAARAHFGGGTRTEAAHGREAQASCDVPIAVPRPSFLSRNRDPESFVERLLASLLRAMGFLPR